MTHARLWGLVVVAALAMIAILAPTPAVGQCTLTCPANLTQSNDPNQCGAVVNYSAPGTSGTCGAVTVSPPSGSFFPVGTTQLIATSSSGWGVCSFRITVADTQPPTITCPANLSGVVATATTRLGFTTFPTSSDNCPGISAGFNQPGAPSAPTSSRPRPGTERATPRRAPSRRRSGSRSTSTETAGPTS